MSASLSIDQPPDPNTLANLPEFGPRGLKGKGRQNGQAGKPTQDQLGLDNVEIRVKVLCDNMLAEKKKSYHQEIDVLNERIDKRFLLSEDSSANVASQDSDESSAVTDAAASDPDVDNARLSLENVISTARHDLKRLQHAAQGAINELNEFRREQHLSHDPKLPGSLLQSWGLLGIALAVETILNGFFFGANLEGALVEGVSIALLISAVNVIVFGFLGAATYRQIAHRLDLRKLFGILGLIAVIIFALCFNFAVAHYRDALPPDQPPAPETLSAEATAATRQIANCWRGDGSIEASQEAWCLFTTRSFRLDGFLSYLLFMIGLAACAFGAWEFSRMTDPYPGFGKLGRMKNKTEEELKDEHQLVLERLENRRTMLQEQQKNIDDNPVEQWEQTDNAIRERSRLYEDFCAYATVLEESCRGAIEIYRTANRSERKEQQLTPPHWGERWEANWNLPDEPTLLRICPRNKAETEKQQKNATLIKQLKAINDCFAKCKEDLDQMTYLEYD